MEEIEKMIVGIRPSLHINYHLSTSIHNLCSIMIAPWDRESEFVCVDGWILVTSTAKYPLVPAPPVREFQNMRDDEVRKNNGLPASCGAGLR